MGKALQAEAATLLAARPGPGLSSANVALSSVVRGAYRWDLCCYRLAVGLFLALTGCAKLMSSTPGPPPLPPLAVPMPGGTAPGSLWQANRAASYSFLDVRPRFPGDLLTVVISESAQGKKDADTKLDSESSVSASVQDFFGIPSFGSIDPSSVVKAESKRSFDGEGETTRKASLTGQITVTVTAVEPNGNLHVEGQKVVSLNNEEEYIVLRGVVRPEDIDTNNQVPSWRLADARVDFYGSGVVANQQGPGVIYTLLDWLWPF
jgi:flagellar L-ring protein precursor FlgH